MHNIDLILVLSAGFLGALVFGYITQRLGWSPIVGYLIAGVLVGPHTPGFVANAHLAEQLAEVGVILLMFGVGLHFHFKDLLAVKRIATVGAVVQSIVATTLGAVAAHMFGWNWSAGIVFGLTLSVASTVVLIRVLTDNGELHSATGRIAIGWLVVEDIFTVFILVLLPVVFAPASQVSQLPGALAIAAVKLIALISLVLFGIGRLIPWILTKVAETQSRELFTLSVLAIALGVAAGSSILFGVSMALGAFLAGMVVGRSEFSARAGAEALPMRDAFAVMFFLSVGMLFDPGQALKTPLLILTTLGIVMAGKPLAALIIARLLGQSSKVTLGVAVSLAQIGEFSFLLASLGIELGVLPETARNPIIATAIISIILNPVLYRTLGGVERFIQKRGWLRTLLNRTPSGGPEPVGNTGNGFQVPSHRAVIVGYGHIGQRVARVLLERGIEPTIIEMNIDTFRRLRTEGYRAVYGDANQKEVLVQAGTANAASFILSASGSSDAVEAIRIAREINPGIHVVVRADYLRQSDSMRNAGADEVFTGEGEVVLAMTDSILRRLGATPEQLDRERERLRAELRGRMAW